MLLKGFPAGTTQPTEVAPPRLAENGTVADYQVILAAPGQSDAAMAIVRGPLQAAADTAPPGSTALIGGRPLTAGRSGQQSAPAMILAGLPIVPL